RLRNENRRQASLAVSRPPRTSTAVPGRCAISLTVWNSVEVGLDDGVVPVALNSGGVVTSGLRRTRVRPPVLLQFRDTGRPLAARKIQSGSRYAPMRLPGRRVCTF
ncbi:unnamed protein product, partial [Ectocarpus sp. 12 AP-2014]